MPDFGTSVERLLNQVRHWEQSRWTKPKSQQMYGLVQFVADMAADVENRERRPVPRMHDMVLPDQLRVMADDLLAAGASEPQLAAAAEAVDSLRRSM